MLVPNDSKIPLHSTGEPQAQFNILLNAFIIPPECGTVMRVSHN